MSLPKFQIGERVKIKKSSKYTSLLPNEVYMIGNIKYPFKGLKEEFKYSLYSVSRQKSLLYQFSEEDLIRFNNKIIFKNES